jgi:SAM-dependent methyltransferase
VAIDKLFAGSIPEIYDRFLVPLIFEPYALHLVERLGKIEPQNVLEVAAGTGVLTRAIASRLPAQVQIVATDLNRPMLDHAAARQCHDGLITWRQADALALPFEDQTLPEPASGDDPGCACALTHIIRRASGHRGGAALPFRVDDGQNLVSPLSLSDRPAGFAAGTPGVGEHPGPSGLPRAGMAAAKMAPSRLHRRGSGPITSNLQRRRPAKTR